MDFETEILAPGKWSGSTGGTIELTEDDLAAIVEAFNALSAVHHPPVKLGHNDEQPMTDGQPALGWISAVRMASGKIVAKLTDVPEIVGEAIKKKLYRKVSAELLKGVTYQGQKFKYVLDGLALLGADIPAVNTLADLGAYLSRFGGAMRAESCVKFSAMQGNIEEKPAMAMTAEEKAEFDALKAAVKVGAEERVKLAAANVTLEAEKAQRIEAEGKAEFAAHKKEVIDGLETLVKDKKITPAQRDEVAGLVKEGDKTSLSVAKATLGVLSKGAVINVNDSGTRAKGDGTKSGGTEDGETEEKASTQLAQFARELRATNPKLSWDEASRIVFHKHPKLADAYVHENGEA